MRESTQKNEPSLMLMALSLWIELVFGERSILLGGINRPPNSNNDQWLLMEQSIDQAFSQNFDNIIVTGDFNMNLLGANSNKITNLFSSYNAEQLITSPTFYTESSNSLLDLMFIKNKDSVISSFVADPFIPNLTRFHCPVVLVLRQTKPKRLTFKRRIWLYENGDYDAYRTKLHETDWNSLTDINDFDIATKNITNTILLAAEDTIPSKIVTIRPNDVPWMNNEIRNLIKARNKIHKHAKKSDTPAAWAKFRAARNKVTKQIHLAKHTYQNKLIQTVNSSNVSAKTWFKIAKQLTNKQSSQSIPTLFDTNFEATTDVSKANLLNIYFSQQSNIDDHGHDLPQAVKQTDATLDSIVLNPTDVRDAISSIDPTKACGPDLISPKLLREGTQELCVPLSTFFNKLLVHSYFPDCWKLASVTPVVKKGDPSRPSNYRPISLLSCIGKLFERCVHKYIYNYLIGNNLVTPYQSGFIKNDSTVNQLIYIYDDICRALDQERRLGPYFVNF